MNSQSPPSAVDDFKKALNRCTVKPKPAFPGAKNYVRVKKLVEWMLATAKGHNETNAQRLIQEVYRNYPSSRVRLPNYETICRAPGASGNTGCAVVFSILLEMEQGQLIDQAKREGIVDTGLPMDLSKLTVKFSRIDPSNGAKWANTFYKKQPKYCPFIFEPDMDLACIEELRVLPICRKREIGKGGQASVFAILVQADYVTDELASLLPPAEDCKFDDRDFGECFQFALKSYEPDHESDYLNEREAFEALRGNKGIIQCLGSFGYNEVRKAVTALGERDEDAQVTTWHILLEYGRFDLMTIFMHRNPPALPEEINFFWASLIEIANALNGIHRLKTDLGDYHGWHNDVKPGNIIVVDDKYKLADPGFAKFRKLLATDGESIRKIKAGGMTKSYAAPECFHHSPDTGIQVDQSADVWSVGCVLSMAATWVVLGIQGIHQFKSVRQKGVENHIKKSKPGRSGPKMTPGDYFHNGEVILPEVLQWHLYLRRIVRRTDQITESIIDFVEEKVLIPSNRLTAADLYERLTGLVQHAAQNGSASPVDNFADILLPVDEEASTTPQSTSTQQMYDTTIAIPSARPKTKRDKDETPPLLKTTGRHEVMSKLVTVPAPDAAERPRIREPGQLHYENGALDHRRPVPNPGVHVEHASEASPESAYLSRRTSTLERSRTTINTGPAPQNVIQAWEEVRDSLKMFSKQGDPDEVLNQYFDKRDIVFLVDNVSSMEPFWDEATFLLETLFLKTKPFDDKLDLHFTMSQKTTLEDIKDVKAFRKQMVKMRPKPGPPVISDMVEPIERIFGDFFNKKKKTKDAITLIVLTDGKWEDMDHSDDVFQYIKKLLRVLEKRGLTGQSKRPASIQFIQFGDDLEATERLRALDDDLEKEGFKDIIDHEMFNVNGDIRKMLAGSFVRSMDRKDELSPTRSATFGTIPSMASSSRLSTHVPHHMGLPSSLKPIPETTSEGRERARTGSTASSVSMPPSPTPTSGRSKRLSFFGR